MALTDEEKAAIETKIADIEAILAGGLTTFAADGLQMQFDPRALERERRRLQQQLNGRRPMFRRITLGNVNP